MSFISNCKYIRVALWTREQEEQEDVDLYHLGGLSDHVASYPGLPRPPQAFIACSMKSPFHTASDKSLGRPGYDARIHVHGNTVLSCRGHMKTHKHACFYVLYTRHAAPPHLDLLNTNLLPPDELTLGGVRKAVIWRQQ